MHIRVKVHRWVVWWFYVGVFCGGIAVANILGRDLSRPQERLLLLIGVLHWLLGGVVCWAFEGVQIHQGPRHLEPQEESPTKPSRETEWHPASDFLLPGNRHGVLPPSGALGRRPRKF